MRANHYLGVLVTVSLLIPALWAVVHAADKTAPKSLEPENYMGDRATLRGLQGVRVVVENVPADVERRGLTRGTLQTDTELQLRQYGIRVLTQKEQLATPGGPWLYVLVHVLTRENVGIAAVSTDIELWQTVHLARDPTTSYSAVTWEVHSTAMVGMEKLGQVRDGVRDDLAEFINAYLTVNPKQPTPAQEDHGSEAKQK